MASDGSTPPPPTRTRWWVDAVWLILLAAGSAAWCLSAAPRIGVTYDEPLYLDAGLQSWRGWSPADGKEPRFDHEGCAVNGVMPLPIDALSLPLYIYEQRRGERLEPLEEKFTRLWSARAVTIGWLWLLTFSAWRLGRAAGGPWAGRIAAGLIAADPNFLGHASLATTDIAVSATLMAFARAVYVGRGGGWWKRLLLPGLWFGVAALCKVSALLYGGIILVVFEVCYRFASGGMSRPIGAGLKAWGLKVVGTVSRSVLNAAAIIAIGVAVAVIYFGIPEEGKRPFVSVAGSVPAHEPLKPKYEKWAADSGRVPYAVCAFAFQWWWNACPRPSFLNGTYYPVGYRYFFPEVLLLKVPLPILFLALVALPRVRAIANPLAIVTLLLFATLLTANLQLGMRLAFPAVTMGYVAVAVAIGRGYPRCAPWIALPAVLAVAVTSAWVWPNGLGYVNQAHGGLESGSRRLADSNLDWGQGLPELKAWHEANGQPPIVVWYFGTDPAVRKEPFQQIPIEGLPITNGKEFQRAVGPRVLAVGHTIVTLHPHGTPAKVVALDYLRGRRPLVRTATFTLYDFRDEQNGPPLLE